jgi:ferric-dicitrate binding protein FerR (iron transport regulator)
MKRDLKIAKLLFHYIRHELRPGQEKELNEWRSLSTDNESFFQQETSLEHIRSRLRAHEESKLRIKERLQANSPPNWKEGAPRKTGIVVRMLRTAAIVVVPLVILVGGYAAYEMFLNPASPKNFAMMASVNGQRVMMNDFQLGWTAGIKDIKVKRKGHGELLYLIPNDLKATRGQSDSLWTSDRWRFEMRLPDGSDIWMNLSSTIGYPVNLNNIDSVSYSILGEAFFRIPGNTNKYYEIRTDSFLVRTTVGELDVRSNTRHGGPGVLLVSGSASVKSLYQADDTSQPVHLKPGQLARFEQGKIALDDHPDVKAITGWKR